MSVSVDCSNLQKSIHGTVIHFSHKKWGYIQGDDGERYYFYWKDFSYRGDVRCICEGARVEFAPGISEKRGTKVAFFCHLLDTSKILTYAIPDVMYESNSLDVYCWDILELGKIKLTMQSNFSESDALEKLKELAQSFGANALLEIFSKKNQENEKVHYSISATPAVIGAKDVNGDFRLEELKVLNTIIEFNKRNVKND